MGLKQDGGGREGERGGREGESGGRKGRAGGRKGGRGGKVKNGGKFDQGYRWKMAGNLKTTKKPASQQVHHRAGNEPAVRPASPPGRDRTRDMGTYNILSFPRSTTELLVVGDIWREDN